MANSAAVPCIEQPLLRHSACVRLPDLPAIAHPMTKVGDRFQLKVGGNASLDLRRSKTVVDYPSLNIATCVSWSQPGPISNFTEKKRRFRKRAMATRSRSDEEMLEVVTERLVDGFEGFRHLFRSSEPAGQDCVTKDALLQILHQAVGHINTDRYQRLLKNLGLEKKDLISFDTFVSRFKEFEDIQRRWSVPLKREAEVERQKKAHPEENLRDCGVQDWAQLKVAPHATYLLKKALREKKIDFRSILPDECFVPNGVVTKVQLRVALQEIGINLTDLEYKRFWERYDKKNVGAIPLEQLYEMMSLDKDGNPAAVPPKTRTPVLLKPNTGIPPRNPAIAAREFALGRHKVRGDPWALEDGIRGEGIQSPASSRQVESRGDVGTGEEEEKPESPKAEAAARSKIRAVMNQKPKSKFDCIIDSLHYKLEERYISMTMAFKLFDLHQDGSVMRIDFRRVLSEYGFPVTALQLGPLISRVGMSIKHGLISYRQFLSKLMNRTDAFTSSVLDDCIMAMQEGRTAEPAAAGTDTDVEDIARKVVQHLHQDYIKMSADLLRKDRNNEGVLPPEEVKGGVERCLGQGMTEAQWEDLQTKIPYDSEGNVRYADFMVGFNKGEPGAWNQLTHGTVTVPRNKVVNTPTEEVKRLQRAQTDVYLKPVQKREHRPLEQLRQELKNFFKDNLHVVDRRFKELDRKSHKRFSKWQFGAILKLCGYPMTEKELNDVWMSLKTSDDNMSTFNAVVMEFAPNFTPFHGHTKDDDEEEQAQEEKEEEQEDARESKSVGDKAGEAEAGEPPRFHPQQYLLYIITKVKPAVKKNWENLRQSFRNQDPHGFGTVSFQTMQGAGLGKGDNGDELLPMHRVPPLHVTDVVQGKGKSRRCRRRSLQSTVEEHSNLFKRAVDNLRCGLTKEERDQLCAQFDFKRIGRCNYLAFMKMFSEPPPLEPRLVYAAHRHKLQKKPKDAPKPITVSEAMHKVRDKLMKHWKNLRRAFQKHDKTRTGLMTVADFKHVLKECSVPVSEEDLFHILSEFDSNMDGRISYPEFLDALLCMDALTLKT